MAPFPLGARDLSLFRSFQTFKSPPTLLLIINEYWDSFSGAMQPGPEPDHSPPHVMLKFGLQHAFTVHTETLLSLSLMKQHFVTTHTNPQTKIPASLNSWVTNTNFAKMSFPQKNCFSLHFHTKHDMPTHDQSSFLCPL